MTKRKKRNRYPGVTALGDGRYRIRAELVHPKTGRRHEIDRIIKADSPEDAARVRANERAAWLSARTRSVAAGPRRLGEALSAWLQQKRKEVRPSTASTYGSAVAWWTQVLGDYLLEKIEPADVRDALIGAREGGDATDTINGRLRVLRTFAREERCTRIIEGVRALERTVHEDEEDEDEGRGFSLDELRRFLDAGPRAWLTKNGDVHPAWRRAWALVATMAWTGMRFGEASALEWRDVDLDAGTIRVRRAQWRGIVGHVKAKASRRTIVIPDELIELLREHRHAMIARQQTGVSSPLVFPSRRRTKGKSPYVTNGYVGKSILRVCRAAGIDLDGRPWVHVLRHTANNLVRQNASELVRQALIGHADEEVGEIYSKVTAEEKRAAVAAVVRMVRGEAACRGSTRGSAPSHAAPVSQTPGIIERATGIEPATFSLGSIRPGEGSTLAPAFPGDLRSAGPADGDGK